MKGLTGMQADELGDTEEFLLHYQLQHDPFVARPQGFRFFTPGRKPVLAQLHHMAHFSDQVQVVVGPTGAGKTLLRQAMVASCNKDKVQCIVTSAREQADAAGLERLICQALSVDNASALLERAEQLHATGMQLYLVVDDAHCLEQPAVQMLAELSQSGPAAPRVFLFAEESIVESLEAVKIADERVWLQLIELPPFTLEETQAYLAQRLEKAGQSIDLLDNQQISRIHELSDGWPGLINQAARQVMMEEVAGPVRPVRQQRSAVPARSLIALVLVGVGVTIAWMMGGDEPEPTRTVLSLPDQVASLDVTDAAASRPVLQMPGDEVRTLERIAEEPDAEAAEGAEGAKGAQVVSQSAPVVAVDTAEDLPAPVAMPELPPADVPQVVAAPELVEELVAPPVNAATQTSAQRQPAVTPASTPAQAAAAQPSESAYHSEAWYRQRPATEYTLQLIGTRSRQAALSFISSQSGLADLGYFETLHEGKPWFVVTQGAYAGRSQAQQGISRLPQSVQKQQPWPRSMGSIQQSLR